MIPLSKQSSISSSTDILVYPLSSYVITPVNKSSARQRAGRAKERPMVADRRRRTADAPRAHGKEHRAEEDASTARRGDGGGGGGSSHALTSPSPADRPGSHDDSRRLEYRRPQRQFRDQPRRSRHSPGTETPRHRHSPPPVKRQLDRCGEHDVPNTTVAVSAKQDQKNQENGNGVRCSANVVLLAHGNRSLYVLTIQRSQISAQKDQDCTPVTVTIQYKLPGGKFTLMEDEQEYFKIDRNEYMCHDDSRWYAAALEHFMAKSSTGAVPVGDPARQQAVLLGKWYQTQSKEARERINDARRDNGTNVNNSNTTSQQPLWFYYPYKPSHISGQPAGHKRVYAVPDARALFRGQAQFRVNAPPAKVRTVRSLGGPSASVITRTTVYKYKFVPLAALHENNRLYGPILSSLPIVLSSMNMICFP